jgi:predicted AlkP superfamily pyrophosphatase or phosphodiesterase
VTKGVLSMRIPLVFFAAAIATPALATPPIMPPTPTPPPRLIVAVSIDQLSSELWEEYQPAFSGGLARLAQGAVFAGSYQAHAASETCPGHSTILTGTRPARNGIVANVWTDQSIARADKRVYCAEDERVGGTSSTDYRVSPVHLGAPTLGELMKRRWPQSRNVAVAGKDRAAVMMSGAGADQRWYWNAGTKAFASDLAVSPPATVAAINADVARRVATAQPGLTAPPYCTARSAAFTLPGGQVVGNGTLARAAGDGAAFRRSPEFDGTVLALAAGLIGELKLGQGAAPDLISIGLSATDYVGHAYGTGGQEMCLQLMSLDRDLGDFLRFLDSTRLDYALVLTADHGALDIPERLRAKGVRDAAWASPALEAKAMGVAIGQQLGLAGPVLIGDITGDIYIDDALSAADRARAEAAALAAYRAHPQVEAVFTKAELAAAPLPSGRPAAWSLLERVRASFDPNRSGDLYVVLKREVMPIAVPTTGYVSTHGSPWDYDRQVPILFWRRPQFPNASAEAADTVDILPTLSAVLGLELAPGSVDGKCLAAFANVACPTR